MRFFVLGYARPGLIGIVIATIGCGGRGDDSGSRATDIITLRTLGLAYLEENRFEEAEQQFGRLIELVPDDPGAHFLAADLAFHTDDQITTTAHLKRALELGLPLETGRRFLQVAREKKPDHAVLEAFWDLLNRDPGGPSGVGASPLGSPQDDTP